MCRNKFQSPFSTTEVDQPFFSPPIPQTKLSNDLFAALAKPGSQDEDPNYVIDYDTPE
jgi:hypothetical protein